MKILDFSKYAKTASVKENKGKKTDKKVIISEKDMLSELNKRAEDYEKQLEEK